MIDKSVLDLMQCPACGHPELALGNRRQPDLVCGVCGERYPFEAGIADMIPSSTVHQYRYYRTDTLLNLIAPIYDVVAPMMSVLAWQCPPMRYVDRTHKSLGRSKGGPYLACPIGTGLLQRHIGLDHIDGPIIGVDASWGMLRAARDRLDALGLRDRVTLLRCDPSRMPFQSDSMRALQSTNGLHTFHDRAAVLGEFDRVLQPGGYLSGSVLVRGQGALADVVLAAYERWGVFPMPRSREFMIRELEQVLDFDRFFVETHGAVLFYSAFKPASAVADADTLPDQGDAEAAATGDAAAS